MTPPVVCFLSEAFARPSISTGKERDSESGNDYFSARYYGSSMGRFLSPDPTQLYYADPTNPQSFNLYSYVYNNPLANTDPTGTDACATDNGDGTATIVNAADGGAVDCQGNGSYITTNQQVSAVGFNSNGDLSVYGANGSLYNPDGSAYDASQSITVSADGSSSYIGPQSIDSPGTQFVSTMKMPLPNYQSNYPDYSSLFCGGDALKNNGVALGLDAAGFVPGESLFAAGVQTGVAAASFANSMNHSDAEGAGLAYTGGVLTATGALAKQTGLSAAKAVPFAGKIVNGIATAHDLKNTAKDYNTCMAGGKYD
jgi:RHS repeat-associated protein